jgi:negative regulator of flagellin synthesis FlgM
MQIKNGQDVRVGDVASRATSGATDARAPSSTRAIAQGVSSGQPVDKVAGTEGVKYESSVAGLSQTGGAEGPFDAKKVEAIKAQMADGSFKVDSTKVADKLIANAMDLMGAGNAAKK